MLTYVNITKEKRYCYVIVVLNIGSIDLTPWSPAHQPLIISPPIRRKLPQVVGVFLIIYLEPTGG